MDKERGLIRAAGSMGIMTMLSRIAGYVRDNLQATILGALNSADAYVIAFRIPNMLRRLVAEGALTSAFVPTFSRYMQAEDRKALWRFVASVIYVLTATLAAIVALGILFSPVFVRLLAWGYSAEPAKLALTVSLNRLMFPYIFFISMAAIASGILNSFESFALPAFTPVLLNLSIIACALGLCHYFSDPSYAFAIGVLIGGFLQLAVQVPPLLRHGIDLRPPRPFDLAGLREVGRLMLPRVFGVGITQINLVVDSQFATSLRTGSVAFLYYANRVTELSLGVFAISLSTVILPGLSRASAAGDRLRVTETLGMAARMLLFVTLPATVGLVLLRVPIIHVLFERGRFTRDDTLLTAGALAYYALGLLPFAAISVLASAFYAHRDTRTPVIVGALTFFLHLGLNFALREPMAHRGIALSTSISAMVDAILMAWLLRRRCGEFLGWPFVRSAARTVAAAVAMAAAILLLLPHVNVLQAAGVAHKAAQLALLVLGGGLIFMAVAALVGSDEMRLLGGLRSRRP